jgi:hypothetical protein
MMMTLKQLKEGETPSHQWLPQQLLHRLKIKKNPNFKIKT